MRYTNYITYRRSPMFTHRSWVQRRAFRVNGMAIVRWQNGYIPPEFRRVGAAK